jgi:exopolysaccharide production protein ExoQ
MPTYTHVMAIPGYRTRASEKEVLLAPNPGDHAWKLTTEKLSTVIMLCYTAGAGAAFTQPGLDRANPEPTGPVEVAVKIALYATALFFVARRWSSVKRGLWNAKWFWPLLIMTIASTFWSQDASLTLRSSTVLLASIAFAVYFGSWYTIQEQLRLLAWACYAMLVLSFACAIFLPRYGLEQENYLGAWRGVFSQKNNLAQLASAAVLVFCFARPISRAARFFWISSAFILLLLSKSATGLLICSALLITLPLYRLRRAPATIVIPVLCGVGLALMTAGVLATTHSEELFKLIDRSPDLTGRVDLWRPVLFSISKRPWLGYGYSAFWRGLDGESGDVLKEAGWIAGYAHNGFLDITLYLGIIGLATFVIGFFVVCRRAFAVLRETQGINAIWLCTYLAFFVLYQFTEGSLLTQNDLFTMLYFSAAASLGTSRPGARRTITELL